MIKRPITSVALVATLLSAPALAQHSHSHGIGKLGIALDGAVLTLRLDVPLEDLVGFERAPRDDKERAAVKAAADAIRQADRMFVPTAAASCALQGVRLESPVLDPVLLGGAAGSAKPAAGKSSGHAELAAEIAYQCKEPAALKSIEVNIFDSFKKVRRLDVSRIGASGQKASRVTTKARRVEL